MYPMLISIPIPFPFSGSIRTIRLVAGDEAKNKKGPVAGKRWLILGGYFSHINATLTNLYVRNKSSLNAGASGEEPIDQISFVTSATSTGGYAIFSTEASFAVAQAKIHILTEGEEFIFTGGAGAICQLRIVEY